MSAAVLELRPVRVTVHAPPPEREGTLLRAAMALESLSSDWLYNLCSQEGRQKLLAEHGIEFRPPSV
jgi:hypothetical protein